ncbi:MAG: hypothetical protein AB7K67_12860 [Hyphomicrobiaceae bacterium]
MKKILIVAVAGSIAAVTQAFAAGGHCDADMAAINAAMAKAKLSEADMKTVKTALAKGEELHKAGKEEDCEKALAAAQKLVGIKDEHKH